MDEGNFFQRGDARGRNLAAFRARATDPRRSARNEKMKRKKYVSFLLVSRDERTRTREEWTGGRTRERLMDGWMDAFWTRNSQLFFSLTLSPTDERRNFFLEPTREYQSGDGEVKTIVHPAAGPSRPWRQMVESTPWKRASGVLHLMSVLEPP